LTATDYRYNPKNIRTVVRRDCRDCNYSERVTILRTFFTPEIYKILDDCEWDETKLKSLVTSIGRFDEVHSPDWFKGHPEQKQ